MEPIPESVQAADEFGPFSFQDVELLDRLLVLAADVRELVPECIGMSVSIRELDATFTLVASAREVAVLDAVQYVDGGPCVQTIDNGAITMSTIGNPLDEQRWLMFAATKSRYGVASTLSLPIVDEPERVIGGFNLYGASPHCFDSHHDRLADLLGAWAPGAVTNADLSFSSREQARRAPVALRVGVDLARVCGLLAAGSAESPETWEHRVSTAAAEAGVPLGDLVATLLQVVLKSG